MGQSISLGPQVSKKYLTHRHRRPSGNAGGDADFILKEPNPASLDGVFPSRTAPSVKKCASPALESRRQEAFSVVNMEALDGLPRQEGCVSEHKSRRETEAKLLQVCHSCGKGLLSRSQCPHCEHDFCDKCTVKFPVDGTQLTFGSGKDSESSQVSDLAGRSAPEGGDVDVASSGPGGRSQTPCRFRTPTTKIGNAVRESPFFKADQTARALASITPLTTPRRARAKKPRQLSDCVPRRFMD